MEALKGIRILDFTRMVAGCYGTLLLAYHGAEVIKLESRGGGLDGYRRLGVDGDLNASPPFLEVNRNKRSVTVNLKHPRGVELVKKLVPRCDVVVDNFSVDVMARLSLDYSQLRELKPDIIMLRMPGLGTTGPKRTYETWGSNLTAFTGMTYLWNHPNSPRPVGSQVVHPDYICSVVAATVIVAALLRRDHIGEGCFIDLSQAETTAYLLGVSFLEVLVNRRVPQPRGNRGCYMVPHGCYRCQGEDRWCVISIENEGQWQRLCQLMRRPDLVEDPRFENALTRWHNQEELDCLIEAWTSSQDAHLVMERLQKEGIACGVVQNGQDLACDLHLQARGFLEVVDHPVVGPKLFPGSPFRLGRTPGKSWRRAPHLGEDNDYVFGELLGYNREQIQALIEEGILV